MVPLHELDPITTGIASVSEARAALEKMLTEDTSISAETAHCVYSAFRAWTWKAIYQKLYNNTLDEWSEIVKWFGDRLANAPRNNEDGENGDRINALTKLAVRMNMLRELINESISRTNTEMPELTPKKGTSARRQPVTITDSIANANSKEAREIITGLLLDAHDDPQKVAEDIYIALRMWTWNTLDTRRSDNELRQWHDIIRRTSAYLRKREELKVLASGMDVLHELIYESIAVANRRAEPGIEVDVLRSQHVRNALSKIVRRAIPLRELMTEIGLDLANGARLLNLMFLVGLIEYRRNGEGVTVCLSSTPSADEFGVSASAY